ncbi:hypothetical protein Tco_1468465 [Tanacetum coccineum]
MEHMYTVDKEISADLLSHEDVSFTSVGEVGIIKGDLFWEGRDDMIRVVGAKWVKYGPIDSLIFRRQDLMSNLNDLKEMEDMDFVQKAKVRWAIEVKKAFKDHYEARFNKPTKARLKLSFFFPNRLSTDQVADLERHVSHDEIRLAVWDKQIPYLGVMVGAGMTRHKAWDDVILKLQSRLSKWKAKTLSIGGRLTLLKSVLGASPLYNMSIFKVPKGVLKVMESIRSNFFKGASMLEKKISWIAWDKVLASKKKGGLGVSSYFALNRAPPHKVVRKVSIWSFDLKEVSSALSSSGIDVLVVCATTYRGVALDSAPNICVAAKWGCPLDTSFRRSVRGGVEQQEFSDLSSFLNSVVLSTSNDRWYFSLSSSGEFSVKDTLILLMNDLMLPSQYLSRLEYLHRVLPLVGIDFQALAFVLRMDEWFSSIRLPGFQLKLKGAKGLKLLSVRTNTAYCRKSNIDDDGVLDALSFDSRERIGSSEEGNARIIAQVLALLVQFGLSKVRIRRIEGLEWIRRIHFNA